MKAGLAAGAALLLCLLPGAASAHRLDELLQATTLAVASDHVVLQLRLTPGIAVTPAILADLDSDHDGILSPAEQRAYALRVVHALSLTVDGQPSELRLRSSTFPEVAEIQAGLGEILLTLDASIPPGGPTRHLVFENHYQGKLSAYLVNCLIPEQLSLRVLAQTRNIEQSTYQLDYTLTANP